ncbi:hypothetical protein NLJ89_g11280 [Agrocybe chaxingu]|uniref:Uncharacterized protein n=1 Tax=Agrocybe chaxingu TaxID=84603 RepID=A0A9W8JQ85_9AGAR|nr:hypothetical protein NLJ89_g11280 [Agrocybe chaxingu]
MPLQFLFYPSMLKLLIDTKNTFDPYNLSSLGLSSLPPPPRFRYDPRPYPRPHPHFTPRFDSRLLRLPFVSSVLGVFSQLEALKRRHPMPPRPRPRYSYLQRPLIIKHELTFNKTSL